MILRSTASPETEREIIALLPASVQQAVRAHLIMERNKTPETRATLPRPRREWQE